MKAVGPDEIRPQDEPWDIIAYLGRQMHQPISEVGRLTKSEAWKLIRATGRMIKRENPAPHEDYEEDA